MQNPTPTELPKSNPSVEVSSEELSIMKINIPLLAKMDEKDPNFDNLIKLIKELSSLSKYDATRKYELMYKILKVGNLMKVLCPSMEIKKMTDIVNTCKDGVALDKLDFVQQLALFQMARTISADYFHVLYEDQTNEFIESFIKLCQGQCNSKLMSTLDASFDPLSRGKSIGKILSEGSGVGAVRINKLICQMGYFLMKANDLMLKADFNGACMAIVAAGTCGRNFNISGLNPLKVGSIAGILSQVRETLAHIYEGERSEKSTLTLVSETCNKAKIGDIIDKMVAEAESMKNPVNIKGYYNQKESADTASKPPSDSKSSPESPRAYERTVFKK